jgi:hypothetical protein
MRNVPTAGSDDQTLNTAVRDALRAMPGLLDRRRPVGRVGEKRTTICATGISARRRTPGGPGIADEIVNSYALKGRRSSGARCDNVLWGGTIGEDGLGAFGGAHTTPAAYREPAGSRESVRPNRAGAMQQNNEADV